MHLVGPGRKDLELLCVFVRTAKRQVQEYSSTPNIRISPWCFGEKFIIRYGIRNTVCKTRGCTSISHPYYHRGTRSFPCSSFIYHNDYSPSFPTGFTYFSSLAPSYSQSNFLWRSRSDWRNLSICYIKQYVSIPPYIISARHSARKSRYRTTKFLKPIFQEQHWCWFPVLLKIEHALANRRLESWPWM